ncbi:Uncharacterised protein [Chlamydia trachomatis]|nr:Uncharacterised protein [Chlamydia trachomatis]
MTTTIRGWLVNLNSQLTDLLLLVVFCVIVLENLDVV